MHPMSLSISQLTAYSCQIEKMAPFYTFIPAGGL